MKTIENCQKCGANTTLIKNGKNNQGIQRYKCKVCGKTFILDQSSTKHLRLSNHKLKRLIGFMIDDVTLEVIARNLELNMKTVLYYRYLVFHALNDYQSEVILDGTILIDETFISIREKEYKLVRADGKGIRGLSFNQLCIVTMVNLFGISVAKATSRAMPLPYQYINNFTKNIGKAVAFVHDGNTKTYQFINQFDAKKINGRKDDSEEYSTIIIDSYHSNLKRFLFKHHGYRLKNIQHYLNFFVYRQNYLARKRIKNMTHQKEIKNEMIKDLFNRVKKNLKTVTYKTFLDDRGIIEILENR